MKETAIGSFFKSYNERLGELDDETYNMEACPPHWGVAKATCIMEKGVQLYTKDGRKVGNASRRRQRPPGVPESWLQT